jgi:hypothetical protein
MAVVGGAILYINNVQTDKMLSCPDTERSSIDNFATLHWIYY